MFWLELEKYFAVVREKKSMTLHKIDQRCFRRRMRTNTGIWHYSMSYDR